MGDAKSWQSDQYQKGVLIRPSMMEWQNWEQEPARGLLEVSKFSSKPKGKDGAKIEEAIQWERAQTCC